MNKQFFERMARAWQEVTEGQKFVIPEEIPANERTAFHGAAAAAAKAGKSHFTFAGKKHPVTMKKDTATKIADDKKVEKKKGDTAVMNPNLDNGKTMETKESRIRSALRSVLENRSEKYRTSTKPETQDDAYHGDGAKNMKKDAEGKGKYTASGTAPEDMEKKSQDSVVAAGRAGPNRKMRKGDNKAGDSKVVNPAK